MNKKFSKWMEKNMKENGLSMAKIGRLCHVHRATVLHWKRGDYLPSASAAIRLLMAFSNLAEEEINPLLLPIVGEVYLLRGEKAEKIMLFNKLIFELLDIVDSQKND